MSKNKFYNYAIIFITAIFLQLQFGCSLAKLIPSGNVSNANTPSAASDPKNNSENNSAQSETPENCRNAYYPVSPSVERKYHINYKNNIFPDQEYTERYSDFTGEGFVAKTEFKDVSTTINWRCTSDGLLATQYGNSIDMKGGSAAKIDTTNSSGVSFPVESKWSSGQNWTADYDIKETLKNPNGQEIGAGNGKVTQNSQIIGTEEITVHAGTFQTLKVENKTLLDLTVKVGGMSVPTKTPIQSTAWFAKDVGMVKSQTTIGGIAAGTTELLSYKK